MKASLLPALFLAVLVSYTQALYFYIDGPTQKCFFEELPKDTLVVGHYTATQWNEETRSYGPNPDMGIYISVDEIFDNEHRVISQRGASTGRLTFSAADSGEHRICFTPANVPAAQGWLHAGQPAGNIKFQLDMTTGETSKIESSDKDKMDSLVGKLQDLNARLKDIRREQMFQREREAEFRDQSESVNARVVRWTLIQLGILGVVCAWQLSHLRAFFIKQKLT